MTGTSPNLTDTAMFPAGELTGLVQLTELTELVRGQEQDVLARLAPG